MKVGDLVRVKNGDYRINENEDFPLGVIADVLAGDDGFYHFEVAYMINGCQEREWLSDLQLETVNEEN